MPIDLRGGGSEWCVENSGHKDRPALPANEEERELIALFRRLSKARQREVLEYCELGGSRLT